MKAIELQLFGLNKDEPKVVNPIINTLEKLVPRTVNDLSKSSQSTTESLDILFPEQKYEEKCIQKTKEILGEIANDFTTEDLRDFISQIQYLVESWLDDFERITFKGLTLKEFLHEKGGE